MVGTIIPTQRGARRQRMRRMAKQADGKTRRADTWHNSTQKFFRMFKHTIGCTDHALALNRGRQAAVIVSAAGADREDAVRGAVVR